MDRLIIAAFVATFIAAIAAVVGVPVFAQTTPTTAPNTADTPRGRYPAMGTGHDGFLTPDELKLGITKLRAGREAKVN